MSSPLSEFLNGYEFYSVQNSKSIKLIYLNMRNSKFYIKSKEAFIQDIYNIALQYNSKELNIIQEIKSNLNYVDPKKNDSTILYDFLTTSNGVKLIEDTIFKPVDEKIIEDDSLIYLNEYKATDYLKSDFNNGCKDKDSFPNIKELILNLCADDINGYDYFLKVLSHSITKPHIKRHGYIVFYGAGGSGKGTFFELVLQPIFNDYFLEENEDMLNSRFTSESYKKLWIAINEKEEKSKKDSGISHILKYISGSNKQATESKGENRKEVYDYRNFIITTNETNPGLNLKHDDRRATVLGYSKPLGGHKDKSPIVRKRLEKNIPDELDDFVSYLKNLEFDEREIFTSYETSVRKNLITLDMNNAELFIEFLKDFDGSDFSNILDDLFSIRFEDIHLITHDDATWILSRSVYDLFVSYCQKEKKHITAENRFYPDFYNITGLESKEIKKDYKRKKYIHLKDFLRIFNLKFNPSMTKSENDEPIEIIDLSSEEVLIE